jgi:hypothetical protein
MLAPSAFTDIRNATRIVNRRRKRAFIEGFLVRHRLGWIMGHCRIACESIVASSDLDQYRRPSTARLPDLRSPAP